jgi:hypothetical protein
VTMSPTLYPTTRGGGFEALTDTRPGQQVTAPSLLASPGEQGVQAVEELAASRGFAVPAGHAKQNEMLGVPRASL